MPERSPCEAYVKPESGTKFMPTLLVSHIQQEILNLISLNHSKKPPFTSKDSFFNEWHFIHIFNDVQQPRAIKKNNRIIFFIV